MKSGFVSIIGRTNAGKSSLINYLVGQDICMVSHKVNATRRKISGIVMHGQDQIIFTDTPGLHKSNKILNKTMVDLALKSIGDSDLVLFLVSAIWEDGMKDYEEFINNFPDTKHILVISKIDLLNENKLFKLLQSYNKFNSSFLALVPISIKKGAYRNILLDSIAKYLPQNPYFYPVDIISTTNSKEIYRDFILQSIYENVNSEIPYSSDVVVDKVTQKDDLISVFATIITDNEHHKKILIGKSGETIKRIGIRSKKLICDLEKIKIFVKLQVFVKKTWNLDEKALKNDFIY